ncbi:alpha/beta hydrolase [Thalassomonas actiniarum]|uniref:Alpha/beta hydrolase n=1 Tax=Thalassomonas actiniarum TaxID=485447 RepID=A0AAE9YV15_9GAMM|nr:alpha/beta hydrolase [Thalassomonas actiniarum]WDE01087.1 alpha/beta hydrolase [Thalassomonas actiniarum]
MTMYRNFDLATLEREYSPSSCIDDIKLYIKQYIDLSQAATTEAQNEQKLIADIPYGLLPDERLDLYLPTRENHKKLFVYIHGGYWQELSKAESSFAASNFQQHGCTFAAVNYTLAPDASLSEIVNQNRKAVAYLIMSAAEFGYEADEIYLCGSSAGAHLAMMMLSTRWQNFIPQNQLPPGGFPENPIKGICAVSGIYDLTPIAETYINEPLQLTGAEIEQNSPLFHLPTARTPVIFAYGEQETSEFKRQSNEMCQKLEQAGFPVTLKEISKRNHFDVILDLADSNSWLCQQVFTRMQLEIPLKATAESYG